MLRVCVLVATGQETADTEKADMLVCILVFDDVLALEGQERRHVKAGD
jgi:hypothetical protein